ncbi:MAG: RNA-binding protein [Hyphomicrobiaceae bacterium]|nr:RNA-binding protein [Hyphomicrobiaceae bacterium]
MPRKNEPTERQCIVTRQSMPVEQLIRFVLDPEGRVVPDLKENLPGRGVWVKASRLAVEAAEKKRLFGRGFKAEVKVEPGLADTVDALLAQAALGALGFARKAGLVVTGFSKVEATLTGRAAPKGLIHAADAGDDGIRKLAGALHKRGAQAARVLVIREFTSGQLDLAFGRSNVIHAALLAGGAADNVVERVNALRAYRGIEGEMLEIAEGDDGSSLEGASSEEAIPDQGVWTTGDVARRDSSDA